MFFDECTYGRMNFKNAIKLRLPFIMQRDEASLAKPNMSPMIFCFNNFFENVFVIEKKRK